MLLKHFGIWLSLSMAFTSCPPNLSLAASSHLQEPVSTLSSWMSVGAAAPCVVRVVGILEGSMSYLDVGYFYNLYFCVQMRLTITEFLGQVQVSKEPL